MYAVYSQRERERGYKHYIFFVEQVKLSRLQSRPYFLWDYFVIWFDTNKNTFIHSHTYIHIITLLSGYMYFIP